jgi:hypothetical protein
MISKISLPVFTYLLFLIPKSTFADVIPKDSSTLHYINVFFEENFVKGATNYQLQIFSDTSALRKGSAQYTHNSSVPVFRINELGWGKSYYWRILAYTKKNKIIEQGKTHNFKIIPQINSDFFSDIRVEVKTNNTSKHLGGYILIDYLKGIYSREGKLLWQIPNITGYANTGTQIRDLEFTPDNTLTFLGDNNPIEIDLEGNTLWSLPNPFVFKSDTIIFHHDFKKTKEGTYFMLGNKTVYRKILVDFTEELKNLNREVAIIDGLPYAKTDVPILLELNKDGEVIWFWDSSKYIEDVDLNYKKTPIGFPLVHPHANALGVNDENTKVYLGFRDLSRIIKIDKKSKRVELSYGEKYPSGEAKYGNTLFKQQHDARVTSHNSILILNNNGARKNDSPSSIIELKDNIEKEDSVLLWQFGLDFDTLTDGRSNSGGNITEMPNSNILLCAGQLNRIFEVTRSKEVVWDAFIYSFGKQDSVWRDMPNYRGSWVQNFEIGHLLFNPVSIKKKKNELISVELNVYNVNSFPESYKIEINSEEGSQLFTGKTAVIPSGDKTRSFIEFTKGIINNGNLMISLTSVNNPKMTKKIIYVVN